MHSAIRQTSILLALAAVAIAGCRGANPFGRFVQVTKETDDPLVEIEAPEQRLATAKPRTESRTALGVKPTDKSPHVTRTASARSAPSTKQGEVSATAQSATAQSATAQSATAQSAKAQSATAQRTLSDRGTSQSRSQPSKSAPVEARLSANDPAPTKVESSELMEAFSDYPPEVQREALRRLVAATSQRANQTRQPNGIDIAANVDDLPELPEAKNAVSETPPSRLGSEQPSPAPTVSVSAHDPSKATSDDTSELVTTEVETPVVQTVSDDVTAAEDVVKPVSASREDTDRSMVATAAMDSSFSIDVDPSTLTNKLPDHVLYDSLLQRLATPVAGESEAEKASRLIKLRHLMVLSGDPDKAVERIEGLSPAEQEYLRHQLLGLWTMIDPQGHPVSSRRFTSALPQIREAAKFAAAATDSLEVRSLAFCTEIESYGQIKTFTGNRFDAGQQVILYCEIENFTVTKQEEGFQTHLQGSYDIYNDANEKVVSQLLPADEQISANYLRDYFIAYQMHLPGQLQPGTYRLQLTMEDVSGKKYGQASIPFEIAE